MRIAISGSHRTGKSTLIEALSESLPDYEIVLEPYYLLEEEGYEFSDPPTLEDFEAQLERSIVAINESDENTLFDRCPVDCLAYALVVAQRSQFEEEFEIADWVEKIEDALRKLDLIVYVPIESKDRIVLSSSEDEDLRTAVDETIQEILMDDSMEMLDGVSVIEVSGTVEGRVQEVLGQV